MNFRILALLLPLVGVEACSEAAPADTRGDVASSSAQTESTATAATVGLRNVAFAVYDLQVTGSFSACGSDTPEVAEVRLVHPRGRDARSTRGTLSIVFAGPSDLDGCSRVSTHDATFRVRLDATSSMASDPDAIHQLTPRVASDYDVVVNGTKLGVLSVGLPYIMTFDDGKTG